MKLIKGFSSLLYIDPMDGGDIGDSSGALGTGWHCPWPRGRAGGGLRTSGSLVPFTTFEFAAGLWRLFFCTECSWGWLDSTGRPPWKPGGSCPQSTPPAHFGSIHLRVETIDSSQKFWLRVKTLTRNFDLENRFKVLTSQNFRVGTFDSELSTR